MKAESECSIAIAESVSEDLENWEVERGVLFPSTRLFGVHDFNMVRAWSTEIVLLIGMRIDVSTTGIFAFVVQPSIANKRKTMP